MRPVEPTLADLEYWIEESHGALVTRALIGGPEEGDGVIPCPALVCRATNECHVAWELTDAERESIAYGARIWLTVQGGLPIHLLEVEDK